MSGETEILSYEKLLWAFQDYVYNDLESADPEYVRGTLTGVCGLTRAQIAAAGFDYLFPDEDDSLEG